MDKNQNINMPSKIEINQFSNYLQITYKWMRWWEAIFVSVIVLILAFILSQFYTDVRTADILTSLLFLLQVGVGIFITYCVIAGWFNKTNILVGKNMMEINHQPIPWVGNKRLNTQEVKGFYTKEKIVYTQEARTTHYDLYAIMKSGKEIKLLRGLNKSEQARYIKQEIEKYLGIETKGTN